MGFYDSPTFSVSLKGRYYTIKTDFDQWYCTPSGRAKAKKEIEEMNLLPFNVQLKQNYNGDLSYLVFILSNGIRHDVLMNYDYDHPDYEMEVVVLQPHLDMSVMSYHSHGQNKPCYVENWTRNFRAIQVAMQVTFWLNDYYKKKFGHSTYTPNNFNRLVNQVQKKYGIRFQTRY